MTPHVPTRFSKHRSPATGRLAAGALAATLAMSFAFAQDRVAPTAFIDAKPDRPCIEQAIEQGLSEIEALKAAVHSCMRARFAEIKRTRPELFPTEGKPQANRPK